MQTLTKKTPRSSVDVVQVDSASHYRFGTYLNLARWNSYYHQIAETLALKPKSVLIVGAGDNVVAAMLKQQGVEVVTFDFDETLRPDITGNVKDIQYVINNDKKIGGGKFDVLLCCQVLEHLPYENFENILQQLRSVANYVILSLPYSAISYMVEFKLPIIKRGKISLDISQPFKKHVFNGEHHWEVGVDAYSLRRVTRAISKYFTIKKRFTAQYNHYHLFFILH